MKLIGTDHTLKRNPLIAFPPFMHYITNEIESEIRKFVEETRLPT